MGKVTYRSFREKAADSLSQGATFFATGGNLRSSVKPQPEKPEEPETEAADPSTSKPEAEEK